VILNIFCEAKIFVRCELTTEFILIKNIIFH